MPTTMKGWVGFVLLAMWMVVIFLLSHQEAAVSDAQSSAVVVVVGSFLVGAPPETLTFVTRKAAHVIIYLVLGILLYNVVRTYGVTARKAVLLSIACAFGYAVFDEVHQVFIPGRSGEIRDVLIDTTAASLGAAAYALIDKTRGVTRLRRATE